MSIGLQELVTLKKNLQGDIYWDEKYRAIYATDASIYRKIPAAVVHPRTDQDIITLVHFAIKNKTSLIPRTAGTSLAGQCVGEGIVVDTSKYLNSILEINETEKWVRVQPGVNRDRLNQILAEKKLFFPPETATANRAMIGGMVGNNSCGANSIVYGTTREFVLEVTGILSDGSKSCFQRTPINQIGTTNPFVNKINQFFINELNDHSLAKEIVKEYPKKTIHRRNTGYAVDLVLNDLELGYLDLTKLIAGSEGTLMITTEIKLKIVDSPPSQSMMIIPHFKTIDECMQAVVTIMTHNPYTCELMDRTILACTEGHEVYRQYKFFVDGDPAALLVVEFRDENADILNKKYTSLVNELKSKGLGYAYPTVELKDHKKVWDLRKAGLGLMANIAGDKKLIECIEDTAVALEDLPAYIAEFAEMMKAYDQKPLYYAHAGAGEIHLRPLLNMHDAADKIEFRQICEASARLVKKYNGSLSGEHGDGRLRGEFIPMMLGDVIYSFLKRIKQIWDPNTIFNPGKIVDTAKIDEDLRFDAEEEGDIPETIFDFSSVGGYYHAAARCSGSADCRKQSSMGGTMCPSFMATYDEKDSTRARANALKEFYSKQDLGAVKDIETVKEILDLCLSCKGCHNECPSNVDMTVLKSEFMHHYHQQKGLTLRERLLNKMDSLNSLASKTSAVTNQIQKTGWFKSLVGVHEKRQMPEYHRYSFRYWAKTFLPARENRKESVYFFIDEFSNHYDVDIAIKAVKLLDLLGYTVRFADHAPSGRAQFSKGLLKQAVKYARENVNTFYPISFDHKIIGIEPSCILSFRDEYPKLFKGEEKSKAERVAKSCMTIEEFLFHEIQKGNITADQFDLSPRVLLIHGHCHQKALSKVDYTAFILGLPSNHTVSVIPSGCCGMAGSFGYEKEHFDLSMKIGELVLFPSIRKSDPNTKIVAAGTSCRHQITDGTNRKAVHPVEVLFEACKL